MSRPAAAPRRARLTEQTIAAIKPEGRQFCVWDEKMPGFGLRIGGQPSAPVKTWIIVYRFEGRSRWLKLGRWPNLSVNTARELARVRFGDIAYGKDPAGAKRDRRQSGTFQQLAERYLNEHSRPKKRPRSVSEDERYLRRELLPAWANRKAADITRREVIALVDAIAARPARIAANRCLALISSIFSFAVSKEIVAVSPAIKIPKPGNETQRDRILNDSEIRAMWLALDDERPPLAAIFRLALLTGARRTEICGLPWSELDLVAGIWSLPAARSKNRQANELPLPPTGLTILRDLRASAPADATFVFPFAGKSGFIESINPTLGRLKRAVGAGFSFHDLRRSCASGLGKLGVSRLVQDKILNHSERGNIGAVYDRHRYDVEKRAALTRWDAHLMAIASGEARSNVVALRAG